MELVPVPVGVLPVAWEEEEGGVWSVVMAVLLVTFWTAFAEKEIMGELCGREGTVGT